MSEMYFNTSLCDWVTLVHSTIIKKFKLKSFKIEPNDYGYDAYLAVISTILKQVSPTEIFESIKNGPCVENYIESMHIAWCENYIQWKQIQPEAIGKSPKKSLNTSIRNNRATTAINHLDQDDINTYQDILIVVFELLTKKLLEAGVQQLSIK